MSEEHAILLASTIIADIIVVLGVGVGGAFAVHHLNSKVRAAPVPEALDPLRLVLYAASVLFWPLALALGMAWLGKPSSARSARVMLFIAMGHFAFATLLAVAIVTAVAFDPPRAVLDLLP